MCFDVEVKPARGGGQIVVKVDLKDCGETYSLSRPLVESGGSSGIDVISNRDYSIKVATVKSP